MNIEIWLFIIAILSFAIYAGLLFKLRAYNWGLKILIPVTAIYATIVIDFVIDPIRHVLN